MEIDEVHDDGSIDIIVPGANTEVVRYVPEHRIAELEKRLGECEAARETGDKAVARNAELENEAKLHVHGCGKLVAKARAEERERCLGVKPEDPPIVIEPFTDDAATQWACGYEAALDDWEKEIRNLSNPSPGG